MQAIVINNARYWIDFLADPDVQPLPPEDIEGAAQALRSVMNVAEAWDTTMALAKGLHPLMEHRGHWGQWDDFLHLLLTLAETLGDEPGQIALLLRRGGVQNLQGNPDGAIITYRRAWRIARRSGALTGQAVALTNLADIYRWQAQFWRAGVMCRHAVTLFERTGDVMRRAHALNTLGLVFHDQHQWADAARYLQAAETAFAQINNEFGLARVRVNLGRLYSYIREPEKSLEMLFPALDYFLETDNAPEVVRGRVNIGYNYILMRDFVQAERFFTQAEAMAIQLRTPELLALVYHNLGIVYAGLQNWREAQSCFHRALEIWRDRHDTLNSAQTLGDFAAMHLAREQWAEAQALLDQAQALIAGETSGAYATLREELAAHQHKLDLGSGRARQHP